MKKIVLTGGGTAGHVTPNLALIPSLKKEGWEIEYIGSKEGIEKDLIQQANIPYHGIASGKLRRYLSIENLKDPFKVIKGYFEARKILKETKPNVIFSKGGYVTVPVVMAAGHLKIPVVIHESDITPGLANKIAIKSAKTVCVNFEQTLKYVGNKGVWTGTPIREEIFMGNKKNAEKLCGFTDNKPILLMMGGSLGSKKINEVLREALPQIISKFNVIHICGKNNIDTNLLKVQGYKQFEYVSDELPHLLASADIMLSRAGANAISEIIALNIPTLLVPLSAEASRGDQVLNAKEMKSKGYCEVLEEEKLTKESLQEGLNYVAKNKESYKSKMKEATKVSGIQKVILEIERCR